MSTRSWLQQVSAPTYILVMLFGMASWLGINGLWVEVPLLVKDLPEAWNLPSYLVIIIQVANIGPLLFTLIKKLSKGRLKEWPVIYVVFFLEASSCMLLVFFWDYVTVFGSTRHSTALLALTAGIALGACTTSVVFLPYMGLFSSQYMTAYYIGEGLSGPVTGLVGLIQGVGSEPTCVNNSVVTYNETLNVNITTNTLVPVFDPPKFTIQVYFIFLFSVVVINCLAFSLLHFAPRFKQHGQPSTCYDIEETQKKVDFTVTGDRFRALDDKSVSNGIVSPSIDKVTIQDHALDLNNHVGIYDGKKSATINGNDKTAMPIDSSVNGEAIYEEPGVKPVPLSQGQFLYLLLVIAFVNALLNGVIPSTESYSYLPYGDLAFTLAVRLSTITIPLACLLALFLVSRSLVTVGLVTLVGTALSVYELYLAAVSPNPPLKGTVAGTVLVILTEILLKGCFAYVKVTTASIVNDRGKQGALLWLGAARQIGSFIGAVVTFVVVNVLDVLESEPACP